MKLIVGLGNPGEEYGLTRHNVGKMIVGLIGELDGAKLLQSTEYMNNSGAFVKKMLKSLDLAPADLVLVHDDLAFDIGDLRMQFGRGADSHKGVLSVMNAIGTNKFWRVRVGIGSVPDCVDGSDYVLSKLSKKEIEELEFLVPKIKEEIIDKVITDSLGKE